MPFSAEKEKPTCKSARARSPPNTTAPHREDASIRLTRHYLSEPRERRVPRVSALTLPRVTQAAPLLPPPSAAGVARDVRSGRRSPSLRRRPGRLARIAGHVNQPLFFLFLPPSPFVSSRRALGKSRESEKVWGWEGGCVGWGGDGGAVGRGGGVVTLD